MTIRQYNIFQIFCKLLFTKSVSQELKISKKISKPAVIFNFYQYFQHKKSEKPVSSEI